MAKRVSRTIATCGENCLGMIDPHYSGNIEPVSSAPAGVEWGVSWWVVQPPCWLTT